MQVNFRNTREAAEYLGIKKTTLEAWRCRGGCPRYVKLGRAVRYRVKDLDQFVEERTVSHTMESVCGYDGGGNA